MKERSFIGSIGILLYVVLSLIDRFFYKIPDYIYIPLAILGIVIIIVGFVKDKNKQIVIDDLIEEKEEAPEPSGEESVVEE